MPAISATIDPVKGTMTMPSYPAQIDVVPSTVSQEIEYTDYVQCDHVSETHESVKASSWQKRASLSISKTTIWRSKNAYAEQRKYSFRQIGRRRRLTSAVAVCIPEEPKPNDRSPFSWQQHVLGHVSHPWTRTLATCRLKATTTDAAEG